MLDTVKDLLANNKIPATDAVQMSDLLQYLFSTAEKTLRIQVAEVVYRNDHVHSNALDVFLACTLPMDEKAALSRAHRLFNCPSDWQVELMYDGAVKAMIAVFQCNYAVRPGTDAFRRYIVRALALELCGLILCERRTTAFELSPIPQPLPAAKDQSGTKSSRM